MTTNYNKSHNPRINPGESTATYCRRMGYAPGTVLVGDEGYGPTRIQITAVGEERILAKNLTDGWSPESIWTLAYRDWHEVEP